VGAGADAALVGDSGIGEAAGAGVNAAPHWEQKRALGATSAPQREHRKAISLPQLLQKRALIGFSVSQLEQRIAPLTCQTI
jgi:hypothetical protein